MSRSFASASSQYLSRAETAIAAAPLTFAAWAYPLQTNATCSIVSLGNNGTYGFLRLGLTSTGTVSAHAQSDDGNQSSIVESTTSYSANQWQHVCAVFSSSTQRAVYLNAGSKGTGTTTGISPTPDFLAVGALVRSSVASFMNGHIAAAAIWNIALSDNEVAALYSGGYGCDPRGVRPDALVAYWPLINGDGDKDWWSSYDLTATGSPTYGSQAPVGMRHRPSFAVTRDVTAAPTISSVTLTGTSQIGNTLTATVVTDQDPVDSTAYQWEKASDGSGTGAADISGETSSTLALTYADFGDLLDTAAYVRCGAIATKNALPSDEAFSAWQQVTVPSSAGLVSSPLKSPFLIA